MSEILPGDWPEDLVDQIGNYRLLCPVCGNFFAGNPSRKRCHTCTPPSVTKPKDPKPVDPRVARVLGSYENKVTPASIRSLTEEKVRRDREDLLSAVRRIRIRQQDIDALPDRKWINQAVLQICDDVLAKVEDPAARIIGLKIQLRHDIYWVASIDSDRFTTTAEDVAKRLLNGREIVDGQTVEV